MLEKYIPKRFANALIKHVAAVTLFIPYYYSFSYNPYYQDFVLATFFAALFMMTVFTSWKQTVSGIFFTGICESLQAIPSVFIIS